MTITRVLCPVDFSDTSRKALRYAVAVATRYDAVLHVLHVMPDPTAVAVPAMSAVPAQIASQIQAASAASLCDFIDRADTNTSLGARIVRTGIPVAEILGYADEIAPDLIVIGTHGRTGFSHLLMGSTAERVVARAASPVLTIPHHAPEVRSPAMVPFKRILCACDLSPAANHAMEYGVSFAQDNDASLTLLHVIETISEDEALAAGDHRVVEYVKRRKQHACAMLRTLAFRDTCAACEVHECVTLGAPAPTILRAAADTHADLIVMGAQGHGGLGALVFGSTTQTVLRRATCPVLTARVMA